jgi:hypothetical protein
VIVSSHMRNMHTHAVSFDSSLISMNTSIYTVNATSHSMEFLTFVK